MNKSEMDRLRYTNEKWLDAFGRHEDKEIILSLLDTVDKMQDHSELIIAEFESKKDESLESLAKEYVTTKVCFGGLEYAIGGSIYDANIETYKQGYTKCMEKMGEKHQCALVEIQHREKENETLTSKVKRYETSLEFYADKDGEHWAACRPNDTQYTCCHMIAENSGGEVARAALNQGEGEK